MTARHTLSFAVMDALDDAHALSAHSPGAMRTFPERAVQFGTGAFLRGFVDAFIDAANRRGEFNGRVLAVGSTGSGRDRAFEDQDCLYTLCVRGISNGSPIDERRIIASVSRALSATTEWPKVLEVARDPNVRIAFSNTTESGLVLASRDVGHEGVPHSFPAKLTRYLYERATTFDYAAAAAMIVVPCELVENNGTKLSALVHEQAARWSFDSRFTEWVSAHVKFCNTLVDRIVPGTPDAAEHERMATELGYNDALLTVAEPYALFAIEGDDTVAAQLGFIDPDGLIRVVPDVAPYRERKLRLLNGTHTAMAALGLILDIRTVHDAMQSPVLAPWIRTLAFAHIAPALDVPDATAFADAVMQRFANPRVQHRLTDIASQGTLKWKTRLLPVLRHIATETGSLDAALVLTLAAQLYSAHPAERARRAADGVATYTDHLGDEVHAHWLRHASSETAEIAAFTRDVLADETIWSSDLRDIAGLEAALTDTLSRMQRDGAAALVSLSPAST